MKEEEKNTKEKADIEVQETQNIWSKRDLFSLGGWALTLGAVGGALIAFVRFMFPRVLFEPKKTFNAGSPDDYAVGAVNTKFVLSQRVWIIRTKAGFYAISAICTHLGCTPRWLENENKFKCPCHGSGFKRTGINFEGPAPRPLERFNLSLSEDNDLIVNKAITYIYEKGEWDKSYLKV